MTADAALESAFDWPKIAGDLERLLKLRSIPFGMKLFENAADMEAIPRIRRPGAVHTLDQVVAQAGIAGGALHLQRRGEVFAGKLAGPGDLVLPGLAVAAAEHLEHARVRRRRPGAHPGRPARPGARGSRPAR